ncbi:uncharacterized protein MONBRDRAFT_8222 [Monosiga brevicollis MX1]|uniref:Prostaglandin E synthase 2 n=1 Tax=Monosiga brevicollis TaxID=81824 RepID=A9UZE8_MONBE|nr:uncharacterized protein MONBRDRAFT_8222 [Monosiga brevicollis MX1]EDQ89354.1 predicted protein [Monosiga brevicollis MX1]|eukprot:XP_001745930.1 hypothetical protein [Monosiga brevicollis MX1]
MAAVGGWWRTAGPVWRIGGCGGVVRSCGVQSRSVASFVATSGPPRARRVAGLAAAATAVTGLAWATWRTAPVWAEETDPTEQLHAAVTARGLFLHDADVTAYIYTPCPFSTKVRTYLDYYRVPYKKVEVDPLKKRQLAFTSYKKVPVVVINGVVCCDSTAIIDQCQTLLPANHPLRVPDSPEQARWRSWVDEHLVHLLPANIYRNMPEALESFDYLINSSFNFSQSERVLARYSGAVIMYLLCRFKLNKKYGIEKPREELYAAVDDWVGALGERDFLSGDYRPGLADLAVFGALRSMEGLRTLDDVLTHTNVRPWYERMQAAIGLSTGEYVDASLGGKPTGCNVQISLTAVINLLVASLLMFTVPFVCFFGTRYVAAWREGLGAEPVSEDQRAKILAKRTAAEKAAATDKTTKTDSKDKPKGE